MAHGFNDPTLIFSATRCTLPFMSYTQKDIEVLSKEIETEYMNGKRTEIEAVATAVVHLYEGDFCRRRLSLDEEVFSADDVMNAIHLWHDRIAAKSL